MQAQTTSEQIPPNLPRLTPKGLAQMQMMTNGVDAKTALLLTNPYKDTVSRESISKTRAKFKKYTLTAPAIVKLAHHAIKDCLTDQPIISTKRDRDGNEISEAISPTWTNKIACASMVYDRIEPVRTISTNLNLSVECSPVDLDRWQNRDKQIALPVDNSQSGTVIDVHNVDDVSK